MLHLVCQLKQGVGRPDAISDMLSYNGSKRQDARFLSAQPSQLSGPVVPASTPAADSVLDAALRGNPSTAKPHMCMGRG